MDKSGTSQEQIVNNKSDFKSCQKVKKLLSYTIYKQVMNKSCTSCKQVKNKLGKSTEQVMSTSTS